MNYLNEILLNDISSVQVCSWYKLISIQESNEFGISDPTGWPVVHTGVLAGKQSYLLIFLFSTSNENMGVGFQVISTSGLLRDDHFFLPINHFFSKEYPLHCLFDSFVLRY